jgi:sugar O-acyltransferase (sialic acid O-acetyltransferase NeuD family)
MRARLVVLGGPGDGAVVAQAARLAASAGASYTVHGFLNDAIPKGESIEDLPVLGRLEDWRNLGDDIVFCPAIQKVRDMPRRVRRIEALGIPAERWMTVRHPASAVAAAASIGIGCFVASFVTIQPGTSLGDFATIRAGASIGHNVVIEEHAYVGSNATMCGHTRLMRGAHLAPNAVVLDYKRVGCFAVVGIGAAVTKDVRDFAVVMGNPAKRVGFVRSLVPSDGTEGTAKGAG